MHLSWIIAISAPIVQATDSFVFSCRGDNFALPLLPADLFKQSSYFLPKHSGIDLHNPGDLFTSFYLKETWFILNQNGEKKMNFSNEYVHTTVVTQSSVSCSPTLCCDVLDKNTKILRFYTLNLNKWPTCILAYGAFHKTAKGLSTLKC